MYDRCHAARVQCALSLHVVENSSPHLACVNISVWHDAAIFKIISFDVSAYKVSLFVSCVAVRGGSNIPALGTGSGFPARVEPHA